MLEDQNQTESDKRKYSDSKSSRKLAAQSPELKNMEYTNHQLMSKIFQCFRKKLGMSATDSTFSMEAYKIKCIDMRNVSDFVDESRYSSWAELQVEFGKLQEHKI